MWPTKPLRDFDLTLGTGFSKGIIPSLGQHSHFIRRLIDSMLHNIDGEKIHEEYSSSRSSLEKERTVRFNIDLGFPEPALDDYRRLGDLRERTVFEIQETELGIRSINTAHDTILAAMFYFELDSPPQRLKVNKRDMWDCTGHIACRLRFGDYTNHLETLESAHFNLTVGLSEDELDGRSYLFERESDIRSDNVFHKMLTFRVVSLDDHISITLKRASNDSPPHRISGSPCSLNSLIRSQRLIAPFGRSDHSQEKLLPRTPTTGSVKLYRLPTKRKRCETTSYSRRVKTRARTSSVYSSCT